VRPDKKRHSAIHRNGKVSRMGQHHNDGRSGKKKTGAGRGSVKNAARLDAFADDVKQGGGDWGSCNPVKLQAVVVAITGMGGAITLGLSRNGGSHFLTLLLDDQKQTLWYNGDADLDAELDKVVGTLDAMV